MENLSHLFSSALQRYCIYTHAKNGFKSSNSEICQDLEPKYLIQRRSRLSHLHYQTELYLANNIGSRHCEELNNMNNATSEFHCCNFDSSEASVIILVISQPKRVGLLS